MEATPPYYTFKSYLPQDQVLPASQLFMRAAGAVESYTELKNEVSYTSTTDHSLLGKRAAFFAPITESEPLKSTQGKETKSIEVKNQERQVIEAIDTFVDFVQKNSHQTNPVIWHQNQDKLLPLVEQIVYPRLASAVKGNLNPKSEFNLPFACDLISSYSSFIESNCRRNEIAIVELLNLSRSLIDSEQACYDCSNLLIPAKYSNGELDSKQKNILEEAKKIYLERLKTPLAKHAIKAVLDSFEEKDDRRRQDIIESFEKLVDHISLVKRLPKAYAGMVGINQVYIDTKNFFEIKDKDCLVARLVGVFFHEGMHFAQRIVKEDAAYLTPPSKSMDVLYYEGGYCLEHFLYGDCDIKYYSPENAGKMLDKTRWMSERPIFTEEELKANTDKRNIKNRLCSGLCDVSDHTLEM